MPADPEYNWNQPPAANPSRWRRGRMYDIVYQIPGMHKVPRQTIMAFLEGGDGRLIFSGRPLFGTAEINPSHIIRWRQVDDSTEPMEPRKVDP